MTPGARTHSLGPEVALSGLLVVSVFLAATPALRAYRVGGGPLMVAVAAAASVLVAVCGGRLLGLRSVASYGLSLAGLLGLLLAANGPHLSRVATALDQGPNRLLTETLPLAGTRATLSALVVLVWVSGAATSEISVRRAGRPAVSLALAIPVALYALCFAAASSAQGSDRISGPLLLVVLAAIAALFHHRSHPTAAPALAEGVERDGPAWRQHGAPAGLAAVVAVAIVLALVAPAVAPLRGHPAALHRRPPTASPVITDPVDSMAQLRDGPLETAPAPELTVSISQATSGYLPLGYLDLYDGGQWRFSASFQPTGGRVPASVGSSPQLSDVSVTQEVKITGALPLPLLPAMDRPQSVTGLPVVADPASGMLLPQSPVADPAYTVHSVAPATTVTGIPAADGVGTSDSPADLTIPTGTSGYLATTLRFLSALTGQRPGPDLSFLQSALHALQTDDKRTASGPAGRDRSAGIGPVTTTTVASSGGRGTSLSEVINAVTVERAATPEQFATFYAMIARYLGVPARVVTGFRLVGDPSGRPLPAGTYRVTNRQAWTWVEVPVQGYGWVICDPTPVATTADGTTPPRPVSAPATTLPTRQADAVPGNQGAGAHALAPPGHVRTATRTHLAAWVVVALVLGALLLLGTAALPGQAAVRRSLRRRRRRSADPAELAVGALLEMLDGLERAGMRPPPGASASEVAADVGHHFGSELVTDATAVASVADRALFATSDGPPRGSAEQAWVSSQEICRKVLATLDARQRIRSSWVVGSGPSRPTGRLR